MRRCAEKKWPQCNTTETAPLILFSIVRDYESFRVFFLSVFESIFSLILVVYRK